jgi:cytochrome c oxidase assembly protein subunit 15
VNQPQGLEAVRARAGVEPSSITAFWLFSVAFLVLAMVVVGGATRLTGSGLSITEWKPINGAVPPLSEGAWRHVFGLYQATPQYRLVNRGMSLREFQFIYWWEWAHRLLGRMLGAVFLLPFIALVVTRRLPSRLIAPCIGLFLLGGLQGAVGWWMVRSGLEARVSVAPERLAAHLGLALLLFVALIWTGLEARAGPARATATTRRNAWPTLTGVFMAGVYLQCLMGALVAGNHAGLVDTDWPLMGGRLAPNDYWQGGLWATLAHGLSAVQFNHRLLAYGLLAWGLAMAWAGARGALRGLTLAVAVLLVAQVLLGVSALRWGVPLPLAMLHQFTACTLLAGATILAWSSRRSATVS